MKKLLLLFVIFTFSCETEPTDVDVLISGGMIHDGSGMNGYIGNVAINNDTIYYVGTVSYTHLTLPTIYSV